MEKINFKDLPNTDTPINSSNLNQLQDNIENSIEEKHVYSTNEQKIGTWINGKTLYRKVIVGNAISSDAQDFAHGISNLDSVVSLSAIARYSNNYYDLQSAFYYIQISSANITLTKGTGGASLSSYIPTFVIEYTKTTD